MSRHGRSNLNGKTLELSFIGHEPSFEISAFVRFGKLKSEAEEGVEGD